MLNKVVPLSFLVFFAICTNGYSQGEIDQQDKVFFRNERSFSGSLNSNGWGANYRYAKRLSAFSSIVFDVDLASIRHPKEIKIQSLYLGGWGRSHVFGKANEAFSIRGGTGYQKELFSKFDQGGISIRFFTVGGVSLALLKPVYFQKITKFNYLQTSAGVYAIPEEWESSLFDPAYMVDDSYIRDRESFFKGLGETTFLPGVFARAGLCFEYGNEDRLIHALEGGLQIEGFLKKLPILATDDNSQLFLTLFVTYRFGKVIDAKGQK
jgi:hypothetical protein